MDEIDRMNEIWIDRYWYIYIDTKEDRKMINTCTKKDNRKYGETS